MNKDSKQKSGSNHAPTHAAKHVANHDTGQNFQKFAAQLVSPSEVFEPRSARTRVNIPESLELLGSLASLTRSSLVQALALNAISTAGTTGSDAAAIFQSPASTSSSNADVGAKTSNGVQYETSRKEYRQALEDQRIAEALSQLQTHRENTQRARAAQANARAHTSHRSGAVIHQSVSQPSSAASNSSSGFQYASLPEVSVSAKPSPMRKSPGAYQTILRPFNPQNK